MNLVRPSAKLSIFTSLADRPETMAEPESKLRQRTDGRLDRSRDPAILDAALAALAEHGYDATNMNDIAARNRRR